MSLERQFEEVARDFRVVRDRLLEFVSRPNHLDLIEVEIIVAAIDDLTTAIGELETAAAAAVTALGSASANDTALEALVTRVNTVTSDLTTATPAAAAPTAS